MTDKPAIRPDVAGRLAAEAARPEQLAEIMRLVSRFTADRIGGDEAARVVAGVLGWMLDPLAPAGAVSRIAEMARRLDDDRVRDRRRVCLALIASAAKNLAADECESLALEPLGIALAAQDHGFACLAPGPERRADLDGLKEKLAAWSPTGAKGKKSAERILAELIVEGGPALGLSAAIDDAEESDSDAIDRIRKVLAKP